ncbi:MAG TPA: TraB/GumN family protein [Dinghuibacter sp.]|uniref:TraB/GumN family protein n=1 Tax=Dinghuibacter sp. TaxID=2024697 RepID=UPI002BD04261|nr:TraB/GumN family protein [Dinghuibacter sp.]HTJ11162.1 TraB/GumN family protein [Dinghuibacter sp.]
MYRYLVVVATLLCASASGQQNSLLWQISGKGLPQPSYLFGTIHMICPDDFFLTDPMKSAFQKTHTLYLEIDLDDPTAPMKLMGMIQYKNGEKLSDFFDSSDYRELGAFVHDSLKMDVQFFEKFKPLMLYSMMSAKMLPCAREQAYETEFVKMAKTQHKPVKGLETMEEQVSIFDSIPGKTQASMIMDMVRHYDSEKIDFQRMVGFYRGQQIDSLYRMLEESPDTKIDQDLLLNRRNHKWIPLMTSAMRQGSCFIAVGAGHLGGEKGLLALLRRQGYTVRAVQ